MCRQHNLYGRYIEGMETVRYVSQAGRNGIMASHRTATNGGMSSVLPRTPCGQVIGSPGRQ